MGQHTWFVRSKEQFLKQRELYKELDNQYDKFEKHALRIQCKQIEDEIDLTEEFHDLFRTWKREPNGEYTLDVIGSKEECFKWLEDNKAVVGYKHVFDDSPEREEELRLYATQRLNEFWEKYPNGAIHFD